MLEFENMDRAVHLATTKTNPELMMEANIWGEPIVRSFRICRAPGSPDLLVQILAIPEEHGGG